MLLWVSGQHPDFKKIENPNECCYKKYDVGGNGEFSRLPTRIIKNRSICTESGACYNASYGARSGT